MAALQLQWMAGLFDESDSRWKCFARYWLDKAAQPFTDHRGLLTGNTSAVSSSIPWFYSNLVKTYRRYNGSADGTGPNCLTKVMAESLFGNPLIVGSDVKPFFSRSMASEGLITIGDLCHNGDWIPITRLQQDFDVGPYFLKASCLNCGEPFPRRGSRYRMYHLRRLASPYCQIFCSSVGACSLWEHMPIS